MPSGSLLESLLRSVRMFYWCTLVLLTLVPVVTGANAGVKVKLTQMGLDYVVGKAIEIFKHVDIPEIIPSLNVEGLHIRADKLNSVQKFVPTGVTLTIAGATIHASGNEVSGESSSPFKVDVGSLDITATVAVKVETGHLTLNIENCKSNLVDVRHNDRLSVKIFSYINPLLRHFYDMACSKLKSTIADFNPQLATLNAKVLEHYGIDFSIGPVISTDSIELSLKDIFYHMEQPKEIHHSPSTDFTLPSKTEKMFYIGISAFTINSIVAGIHKSGLMFYRITEDMVPPWILSTRTFGAYIPEISQKYPDQKMMLEIQIVKEPVIKFKDNNLILEVLSTMTAFLIQSDEKPSSLFVLDLESSVSAQVYGTELNLALKLTPNKIKASINNKDNNNNDNNIRFEVTKLNSFLDNIKDPVFTLINAYLAKGYPLPDYILPFSLGKIHLANTQVECITTQDYLLIGTDVQFQENASPQHS